MESPQICGKDGAVWLKLIKKDVPGWKTMQHRPENPIGPDSWYELYWALRAEAQRRIERDEEVVGAEMLRIQTESGKHQLKHVDPSEVPPLPKMGKMKLIKTPRKKKPSLSLVPTKPDTLTFSAGSRMKVPSGTAFFKKARCQAKEHQAYFGHDSKLSRPSHKLAAASTRITDVPRSWLHAAGEPADKAPHRSIEPRGGVSVPKRSRAEPDKSSVYMTTDDHERTLFTLINPAKETAASSTTTKTPPPPPQARASAPKRKRVESEEIAAPGPSGENKRQRLGDGAIASTLKPADAADGRAVAPRIRPRAPASVFMPVKRRQGT